MKRQVGIWMICAVVAAAVFAGEQVLVDPEKLAEQNAKWDQVAEEIKEMEKANQVLKERDAKIEALDKEIFQLKKEIETQRNILNTFGDNPWISWLSKNTNMPPLNAKFVSMTETNATFMRHNGRTIDVPLDKLREEDAAFMRLIRDEWGGEVSVELQ